MRSNQIRPIAGFRAAASRPNDAFVNLHSSVVDFDEVGKIHDISPVAGFRSPLKRDS